MIIPDDVRKCVAFLGLQMANGSFKLAGTVFWVGVGETKDGKAERVYAVTARHVIEKIRKTGVEYACLRVNKKDGDAIWLKSKLADWYVHPTDATLDVAVLKLGIPEEWDHLVVSPELCITDDLMKKNEVGLGDEVFITGLFRHHHGSRRNIPIVRVGNIACMGEEKVETNEFGLIDALLVEARSIGGLSGSPVFLNLGVSRMIDGKFVQSTGSPIFYLMGLIHGHYDVSDSDVDASGDADDISISTQQVNTGIAIVVPFHCIQEVMDTFEADKKHQPIP